MPCPHHGGDDRSGSSDDGESDRGIDRREYMKSALLIGGTSALTTTVGLFGLPEGVAADPDDRVTVAERRNRQHAWNDYEREDNGTVLPPEHHLLLFVDYEGDGEPTPGHRKQAGDAFDRLERAFEWDHEGLLFTVSYSVSYFDRFEADLPAGLQPNNGTVIPRMMTAEQIIEGPVVPNLFDRDEDGRPKPVELNVTLDHEDPVADDDYDAVIHLASDHVQNVLAAEAALWGELDEWNDVEFGGANLQGVFTRPESYPDRRTGFAGNGNLADNVDPEDLDDDRATERFQESLDGGAPLSMGYSDLYRNSNPREDNASILEDQRFIPGNPQPAGAFANGSIQHVSAIDNDLEGWYGENDDEDRRERMFSPHHEREDVGEIGENLGVSNAPDVTTDLPMRDFSAVGTEDVAERTEADAEAGENLGHTQKVARARAQLQAHFVPEGDRTFPEDVPLRDDPVARDTERDLPNHDSDVQQLEPGMLRRDFNTVDDVGDGAAGTHFVALQAFSIYLPYMRDAMNDVDFSTGIIGQPPGENAPGFEHEGEVDIDRSGIIEYLETKRRGNYILPPITLRALPPARALRPDVSVEEGDGEYRVTVEDRQLGKRIDPDSVRFGYYRAVNGGAGATPESVDDRGGTTTFVFDAAETGLPDELGDDGTARARLYGTRRSDRHPVFGTATVGDGSGGGGSGGEDGGNGRGGRRGRGRGNRGGQ